MEKQDFTNIGSPVKDFVSNFFDGLEEGLKTKGLVTCRESEAHSKMELNVVATGENSKGAGIRVWGLGGDIKGMKSNSSSQKITVFVKKPSEVEEEEEKARMKVAKVKQDNAFALTFREAESGK
jgi:hypothetical protein